MYTKYRQVGSTKKIISLLGKKNTGKKAPNEDHELGYSDFTLALTLHLPHPTKEMWNCPQCIKESKIIEW